MWNDGMWSNGQGFQGYPPNTNMNGYNNQGYTPNMNQEYIGQGFQGYPPNTNMNGYNNQGYTPRGMKRTTKTDAINMLRNIFCTNEIIKVDEFEYGLNNARHICKGSNEIQVLPIQTYNLQTSEGLIGIQYVYCSSCGRLIINKSCLDML